MIKALFFDIDGTLVSFQTHRIPDSTLEALTLAREKGLKLFISTGRPPRVINNLGDFSFDGFITMNGSYCYDHQGTVLYKSSIPAEDVQVMSGILEKEKQCPCIAVTPEQLYIINRNERIEEFSRLLEFPDFPDLSAK